MLSLEYKYSPLVELDSSTISRRKADELVDGRWTPIIFLILLFCRLYARTAVLRDYFHLLLWSKKQVLPRLSSWVSAVLFSLYFSGAPSSKRLKVKKWETLTDDWCESWRPAPVKMNASISGSTRKHRQLGRMTIRKRLCQRRTVSQVTFSSGQPSPHYYHHSLQISGRI